MKPVRAIAGRIESNQTTAHSVLRPENGVEPGGRNHGLSQRAFLGRTAAGGAALLAGQYTLTSRVGGPPHGGGDEAAPWFEATIPQLQELMAGGKLSSRELTLAYLDRIRRLNPQLNAIIETNPQ